MSGSDFAISAQDVRAAADRLAGIAHYTPVVESRRLNERVGGRVLLKCENLQRTGSFKFRGGFNAVACLGADQARAGVIAFSSGNHAQGVALGAQLHGVDATIVMPNDAPPNKLAATESYGATVVTYDRYFESREQVADELAKSLGRTLIKPFDDPAVMAGQGTVALELLENHPDVDQLAVCVGGGGLLAGCSTITTSVNPNIEIYGVEPEVGDDHCRSRIAGDRIELKKVPVTIADGQQTTAPGELTWPINNALVTEFVAVTDVEIVETMRFLFEACKIVAEPSGASALAAVLYGHIRAKGVTTAVTISGGNIAANRFADLVAKSR